MTPSLSSPSPRYDARTILLHWLTAGLVAFQWLGGQLIDELPRGPLRGNMWSLHFTLGILLALLVVARLVWRVRGGRRLPPEPGLPGLAARAVHGLLYLLLLVTLGAGLFWIWVRGSNFFGLFSLPVFDPANPGLRRSVGEWHETAANLLLLLAGLHAAAALLHHYLWKDGVLRRMGWGG
ncbi:cytochrome b/b6 domain-containing protein [Roseomonas sp. GC11]|uniref:cytochrome b n=1 Tax=Roseomonas sp. GC11 TaxID=2950546 RepID=UPI00210BADE6|nr:cytochrome b/b6 domain-containing protein [Roseomonas sp. GC11]MCQ4158412.1 cytochrome b/b6 domain-containing protein [Roseomonas sp. GC11]